MRKNIAFSKGRSLGGISKPIIKTNASADMLHIALLGPIIIRFDTEILETTGKLAGLFALVASTAGASLSRERLATLLWGEKDSERASHNLRQLVSRIRKLPCASAFQISDARVGLIRERVNCDLWQFMAAKDKSDIPALAQITRLHRGTFCEGLDINEPAFDDWLADQRSAIQVSMADCCIRLGSLERASGYHDLAIAHAKQAIKVDEFREDGHRLLMQALVDADRRSEAIRHYDVFCAFLDREIDSEPDELTQTLAVSLKQETHVSMHTAPVARLSVVSTDWMQRLAETALDGSASAILVIQGDMLQGSQTDNNNAGGAFLEACRALSHAHDIHIVNSHATECVLRASSIQSAVRAGLDLLGTPTSGKAQIGVHPTASDIASESSNCVAIARQLCRLAKPGELLLSLDAREQLLTAFDLTMTDLGDIEPPKENSQTENLRAFSVQASEISKIKEQILPPPLQHAILPLIAIIPFATFATEANHHFLGEMLADELISILSRSSDTRLISRLSTSAFARKNIPDAEALKMLGASYAASGTCYVLGDRVRLTIEFSELVTHQIIFLETVSFNIPDALNGSGHIDELAGRMIASIMNTELRRSSTQPFSTLANSTLMLGAVSMMHQLSRPRFEKSREMLEALTERDAQHPAPHSWLAMYRLLRVSQGWSDDPDRDALLASDASQRALDIDPSNSLALAVDGHIHTQFRKDLSGANKRLIASLESNPSNGMALLFKSTMHAFLGEGDKAMLAADTATRLSPLDPRRWFYDSLAATAAVGAKRFDDAIALAKRSIQANATHTSTYRALAIAQSLSGKTEDARETVRRIMTMQPTLTASGYRSRHPTGDGAVGEAWANALRAAGVPN